MVLEVQVPDYLVSLPMLNEILENRRGLIEKMVCTRRIKARELKAEGVVKLWWEAPEELTADEAAVHKAFIRDLAVYSSKRKNTRYNAPIERENEKISARYLFMTIGYKGTKYHRQRMILSKYLNGTMNPYYIKQY